MVNDDLKGAAVSELDAFAELDTPLDINALQADDERLMQVASEIRDRIQRRVLRMAHIAARMVTHDLDRGQMERSFWLLDREGSADWTELRRISKEITLRDGDDMPPKPIPKTLSPLQSAEATLVSLEAKDRDKRRQIQVLQWEVQEELAPKIAAAREAVRLARAEPQASEFRRLALALTARDRELAALAKARTWKLGDPI